MIGTTSYEEFRRDCLKLWDDYHKHGHKVIYKALEKGTLQDIFLNSKERNEFEEKIKSFWLAMYQTVIKNVKDFDSLSDTKDVHIYKKTSDAMHKYVVEDRLYKKLRSTMHGVWSFVYTTKGLYVFKKAENNGISYFKLMEFIPSAKITK